MSVLLSSYIDQQTRQLRETSLECGNTATQIAARIEICTRLRGRLPLAFDCTDAFHIRAKV